LASPVLSTKEPPPAAARRVGDKRLPGIIRRFLQAGMMAGGVCIERYEGTPPPVL
jgi:hypothetical protein